MGVSSSRMVNRTGADNERGYSISRMPESSDPMNEDDRQKLLEHIRGLVVRFINRCEVTRGYQTELSRHFG
jgi:hypothetical protein